MLCKTASNTDFVTLSLTMQQAKTKGSNSNCDLGVKYADKRTRHFDEEKMKAGQCVIGLQVSHAQTMAITTEIMS